MLIKDLESRDVHNILTVPPVPFLKFFYSKSSNPGPVIGNRRTPFYWIACLQPARIFYCLPNISNLLLIVDWNYEACRCFSTISYRCSYMNKLESSQGIIYSRLNICWYFSKSQIYSGSINEYELVVRNCEEGTISHQEFYNECIKTFKDYLIYSDAQNK